MVGRIDTPTYFNRKRAINTGGISLNLPPTPAAIPDFRIGFPGVASELVGVVNHAPSFTTKPK